MQMIGALQCACTLISEGRHFSSFSEVFISIETNFQSLPGTVTPAKLFSLRREISLGKIIFQLKMCRCRWPKKLKKRSEGENQELQVQMIRKD